MNLPAVRVRVRLHDGSETVRDMVPGDNVELHAAVRLPDGRKVEWLTGTVTIDSVGPAAGDSDLEGLRHAAHLWDRVRHELTDAGCPLTPESHVPYTVRKWIDTITGPGRPGEAVRLSRDLEEALRRLREAEARREAAERENARITSRYHEAVEGCLRLDALHEAQQRLLHGGLFSSVPVAVTAEEMARRLADWQARWADAGTWLQLNRKAVNKGG
jgi:hypothetical protein